MNMQLLNRHKKYVFLFVITIILEFFLSNNIFALLHPQKQKTLDLNSASTINNAAVSDGKIHFYNNGDAFELELDSKLQAQNIYLDFTGEEPCYVTGKIDIKDESRTRHFNTLNEFELNPGGKENEVFLPLQSRGNITAIRIELTNNVPKEIILKKVVLNYDAGIEFNWFRWLLLMAAIALLWIIRHYHLATKEYDCDNRRHSMATIAVCTFNLIFVFIIAKYAHTDTSQAIEYPLKNNLQEYSIMVQQFDAFQKGQFSIDLEFDQSLETLDNPYDYSERLDTGNHWWSAWDHVYKNGKIYSYFGAVPILTIYYPYYWITGMLPSDAQTAYFISFIFIVMCTLLVRETIRTFNIRTNVLAVLSALLLLPCASLFFMMQSCADIYYIPIISAILFLTIFLYATLKAYHQRDNCYGILWFAAAALFLVLAVASRPMTTVPFIALAAPLYLHILLEKERDTKQKFRLCAGFVIPVVLGAMGIMWYNAVRFGSPFDFGVSDQLTISDIHYNKFVLSAAHIRTYIQQYWLLPLNITENFPFISFNWSPAYSDGSYVYHQLCMGILAIPLNYMLLFTPSFIKSKPCYQKAMFICGLSGSAVVLYMSYCLGGIHLRYSCDVAFVLVLLSTLITFSVFQKLQEKQMFYVKKLLFAVLFVSIIIGYCLVFINERNYIRAYSTDFYLQLKKLFMIV